VISVCVSGVEQVVEQVEVLMEPPVRAGPVRATDILVTWHRVDHGCLVGTQRRGIVLDLGDDRAPHVLQVLSGDGDGH
jgi:hypothetical protein